jgi:hypothetical protein
MDAQLVPLSSAAATAYRALVARPPSDTMPLPDGVLDVAAIALAACMPIYGARLPDEPVRRLSDAELAGGRFARGAARLDFAGRMPPFTRLAVAQAELTEAIARLKRAGVNFSQARFEPAPRRTPTVWPDVSAP